MTINNNKYYILRHGNSVANQQNLIVSNPAIGIIKYGLSDLGKEQVKKNIKMIPLREYMIFSSPFKRTSETAKIASEILGVKEIHYHENLVERCFGDFDMASSDNYNRVWEQDKIDPNHKKWNVESASQVLERMVSVVMELELNYKNIHIILVSHGDAGQLLECAFKNINPSLHRSIIPLEQSEFRALN